MPQYVVRFKLPEPGEVDSIEELEQIMREQSAGMVQYLDALANAPGEESEALTGDWDDADEGAPDTGNLAGDIRHWSEPGHGLPGLDDLVPEISRRVRRPLSGRQPVRRESPSRPEAARVRNYQTALGGGLTLLDADSDAAEEIETRYGADLDRLFGMSLPEPAALELLDGGAGIARERYHLQKIGVDAALRKKADGNGVRVSVIDSGLFEQPLHPELARTTIIKDSSFDYRGNSPTSGVLAGIPYRSGQLKAEHYHGTAVAGLVCGETSGVAPGAALVIHNVFYTLAGMRRYDSSSFITQIAMNMSLFTADILVMSLGVTGYNPAFEDEVAKANRHKKLVVLAVGNDGPKSPQLSPGDYQHVLTVGATTIDDEAWFNPATGKGTAGNLFQIGDQEPYRKPDIYAPGGDLVVPVPQHIDESGYLVRSGTSFAAPLVAGVAALVQQRYRDLHGEFMTTADLRAHLLETADEIALPENLGSKGRRVNAARAVNSLNHHTPT